MDNTYLCYYGVKGMKWGVRRYQNKDGSLTPAGKNIQRNKRYTKDINDIVDTLSKKEKEFLGAEHNKKWIDPKTQNQVLQDKLFSVVIKNRDVPVSFVEVWSSKGNIGQISIATRSGKDYRGKGYASKAVKKAIDLVDRYGDASIKELQWIADNRNIASINLAKKYGFEKDPEPHDWDNEYTYLIRKNTHYTGK